MINSMNNLREGKLLEIKPNMAFPLMRWCCGNKNNIPTCHKANKLFFKVKPKYILSILHFGMDKYMRFIKYPKSKKIEIKKLDIVKKYMKIIYKWSDREFNNHQNIMNILHIDKDFIIKLNKKVGFDKKECKIMEVIYNVKKEKFKKEPEASSLFSFS